MKTGIAIDDKMKNQDFVKRDKKPRLKSEQGGGHASRAYCYEKIRRMKWEVILNNILMEYHMTVPNV